MIIDECIKCKYYEDILTASEYYSQCNCPEYNTTFPEFKGKCPYFKDIERSEQE